MEQNDVDYEKENPADRNARDNNERNFRLLFQQTIGQSFPGIGGWGI